jgi:pimeloyl-ACP methyl ester carboxylesterase
MTRLETAPTEFVKSAGITFAYRRLGTSNGIPLVLLQHFTGHMDSWDPAVVNGLGKGRPVIVFDNTGVGQSSGATPDNVAQMTEDAARFMSALGLTNADLLGFSLGGFVMLTVGQSAAR